MAIIEGVQEMWEELGGKTLTPYQIVHAGLMMILLAKATGDSMFTVPTLLAKGIEIAYKNGDPDWQVAE